MRRTDIAHRRMHNSGLAQASFTAPADVVRHLGAMQAQDYGPAKWSVGQRARGLVDNDIDQALASGAIIRTHVLRPTWHFVMRNDVRWLLALTGPRVRKGTARRFRELGLDDRTLSRSTEAITTALQGGRSLARKAIGTVLDQRGIDRSGQRLPHILLHLELDAVIGSGPLNGKQQTYALLEERVLFAPTFDRDEALVELTRRYLTSHGPATTRDLGWWASLTAADIKRALALLGEAVTNETIDGLTFWSMVDSYGGTGPARGAHLLQVYDELLVGYTRSRYFGDPRAEDARAAWTARSLPTGVVLIDGLLAGHWRRTVQTNSVDVELLLYERPTRSDMDSLEVAADDLARFVGRPSSVRIERL